MTESDTNAVVPEKRLRAVQGGIREHGLLDRRTLTFYIAYKREALKYSLAYLAPLLGSKSEIAGKLLTTQWAGQSRRWAISQRQEFARLCAWIQRQSDVPACK